MGDLLVLGCFIAFCVALAWAEDKARGGSLEEISRREADTLSAASRKLTENSGDAKP